MTKKIATLLLLGSVSCGGGLRKIDKSRPASNGEMKLHAGFSPDPARLEGHAVGEREIAYQETDTGFCRGWVGRNPDHYLALEDRFDYLGIEIVADADTSLLIEGPDGRFCSDDQTAGNRNPRVAGFFREGDYAIWVGTTASAEAVDYQIYFSQSEPM